MNDADREKPELHVDEDWKSRVDAEKEALKRSDSPAEHAPPSKETGGKARSSGPIPPASFATLITTLATQSLVALGQTGEVEGEKVMVDFDMAKHFIDTLDLLEQKTKGNLTAEEASLLTDYLHQLRMLFVTVQSESKKQQQQPPPPQQSSIELP